MIEQELVEAIFESNRFLVRKGSSSWWSLKRGFEKKEPIYRLWVEGTPRVFQNDSSLNVRFFLPILKK